MHSIYLLRHGDYSNPRNILPGRLPVELSEKGINQCKKLHEFFKDKNISHIYSSEVLRCKQTSTIISGGAIPITFDTRLLETFSAYQGYWDENWNGREFVFYSHRNELGGENLQDLQKRMSSFWEEIIANIHENVIICSHGDPLITLYAYVNKLPLPDENAQENDIPYWFEKGECKEIKMNNGRVYNEDL